MSPLKVAVIGANGKVGRLVIKELVNDPTNFATPLAVVRSKEQQDFFQNELKIDATLTSVEHSSVSQISDAIKGYDAVIFSAGAGGKGIERIFTVDLDGCVKAMEACEAVGIKRFILVSAIKAEDRSFWWNIESLRNYYIAKRAADHEVRSSTLDYTILQPGNLTLEDSIGKFTLVKDIDERLRTDPSITRADVALFIKECLKHPKETSRKTIPLLNGDRSVNDIIKNL
ncbi:hypothetical protein KAFR_0A00720 [Kazachstania africana CBS 2517]|uniref:NAD(P)-binding domain-containing protein n=1 Tax=Kazachstania africana (strain ATCC 22294 / BCRC 22015 / CBS 2517 / CECT 1963 / NBRC 1671 / NRRL Y-8276) TaxID=1071382 RepID=H2AMB0_KAZAF|nr:hypothetical protein KAFR_0A00720 [Kazachstania africana CBS 2517]CCF55510.1 hypothetical protein KAFR_0A00720 [Kazachstania africana CBS 2517]